MFTILHSGRKPCRAQALRPYRGPGVGGGGVGPTPFLRSDSPITITPREPKP